MRAIVLTSILTLVLGCGPAQHSNIPLDGGQGKTTIELNSFAALSKNIFDAKCVECHKGPHARAGVDLSSYEKIMNSKGAVTPGQPLKSDIYQDVKSGDMPDGDLPLSDDETQAIFDWIAAGAPNGEFFVTPKFKEVQAKLFDPYCVKCHSGPKPKKKIDLTDFNKIMAVKGLVMPGQSTKSDVVRVIEAGKMPPKGVMIPADALDTLKAWIDGGALNN